MPDIVAITAFLASVKNATDIAKAIRGADISLEKAEAKLKMAELIESLADARMQAAEIQDVIQDKDKKIAELENAFELKSKLIRQWDAYYLTDDNGNPTGGPYCSHCWEVNHRGVHLHHNVTHNDRVCPACNTSYIRQRARSFETAAETDGAT
jgi:hypothetical protein